MTSTAIYTKTEDELQRIYDERYRLIPFKAKPLEFFKRLVQRFGAEEISFQRIEFSDEGSIHFEKENNRYPFYDEVADKVDEALRNAEEHDDYRILFTLWPYAVEMLFDNSYLDDIDYSPCEIWIEKDLKGRKGAWLDTSGIDVHGCGADDIRKKYEVLFRMCETLEEIARE